MCDCEICRRIELIKKGENPYFVRELETGYVVLGDSQRFQGYSLLLCKEHATELHFLEKEYKKKFLEEMSLTAEAVSLAFKPDKLNYELLGAGNCMHMHWHIFPRRKGDTPAPGPVWMVDPAERNSEKYIPDLKELDEMKAKLNEALDQVLSR